MSIACFNSRVWLHDTVQCWVKTLHRSVSTSSAINRGLRATREADRSPRRENTERGPVRKQQPERNDTLRNQTDDRDTSIRFPKFKKFTSGGERPTFQFAPREGNKELEPASQLFDDVRPHLRRRRESASHSFEKYEYNLGRLRGRVRSSRAPTRDSTDVASELNNAFHQNPGASDRRGQQKHLPPAHPQLQSALTEIKELLMVFANKSYQRYHESSIAPQRKLKASAEKEIKRLLEHINERMQAEEWSVRNVRKYLNKTGIKVQISDADKSKAPGKSLYFDVENKKLELLALEEGSMVNTLDSQDGLLLEGDAGIEVETMDVAERIEPTTSAFHKIKHGEMQDYNQGADINQENSPASVHYTTASSVFLYGTNTVLACLRAAGRNLYTLYIQQHTDANRTEINEIKRLARTRGVATTLTKNRRLLDTMSDNRPHNGVVLEVSRLPAPPVLAIGRPDLTTHLTHLDLDRQSSEDAATNGTPKNFLPSSPSNTSWRHPFVLMLDGITDPGNVGAILRTSHFYGVDAVAIATNTCANLNSAVLGKASSGACEAIRLLALPKPSNFVYEARRAGWKIFAAVAPDASRGLEKQVNFGKKKQKILNSAELAQSTLSSKYPCILMLGAEGEGLRENLKEKADFLVTIEGQMGDRQDNVGVDSLNVSAATSVLLEAFLRRKKVKKMWDIEDEKS